jgi:hypothetical protein
MALRSAIGRLLKVARLREARESSPALVRSEYRRCARKTAHFRGHPGVISPGQAVDVLFDVCVAVAVAIGGTVVAEGIEAVSDLPGVRHAVSVGIGGWGPGSDVGITTDVVGVIDDTAGLIFDVIEDASIDVIKHRDPHAGVG